MMRITTLCLGLLFITARAHGGGWLQQRGSCYAKVYDRLLIGNKAYSAEGLRDLQDVPSYQDHLLNVYGECGISNRVTLTVAAAPLGYAKADEDTFYVGPLMVGARLGVRRHGRLRLALSLGLGVDAGVGDRPIAQSDFQTDQGERRGAIYQPTVDNMLAQLAFEGGLGFQLGSIPGYVSAALGARLNSAAGVDHALIAQLAVGAMFLSSRLVTDLHFGLYEPFGQAVTVTNTAGAGQTRYLGFGFTFSYWFLKRLAAFVILDGVFYAESNAATPSIGVGLETRFSL